MTIALTSEGRASTPAVSMTRPPVIVIRRVSLCALIFSVLIADLDRTETAPHTVRLPSAPRPGAYRLSFRTRSAAATPAAAAPVEAREVAPRVALAVDDDVAGHRSLQKQ